MMLVILIIYFGSLEALHCDKEYNQIESFYERGYDITCQGLTNEFTHLLQEIEITNEISLKIENSTLTRAPSKLFQNVKGIKHFCLENSTFSYDNSEPIFKLLGQLEDLKIINTKFKISNNTFENLENLKELTLVNNKLHTIERGSFKSLKNLAKLHITVNYLNNLDMVPFCELSSLTNLNFSKNEIDDLGQAFYCENIPEIPDITINKIKLPIHTNVLPITPGVFSTELHEIDLSDNHIKDLGTSFAFLKSLRIIKLQGNQLNSLNNSYFSFLEYLENIRVDDNKISFVEDNVFNNKHFLERIDLSNNRLSFLNLKYLKTVMYLNLAGNKLGNDTISTIDNNNLEILILDNNTITEVNSNIFIKYSNLKSLYLAKNQIRLRSVSLQGLFNLKQLDLSHNGIAVLPKGVFSDLRNLTFLDLSQNNLTILDSNKTFANLQNLEILNLSKNSLTSLDYNVVKPLIDLEVLDLSYNKLYHIDYEIILTNLPLLGNLDVKFNAFTCEMLLKIIKYLKTKGVTYTLQANIDLDRVNVGGIYCVDEKVTNYRKATDSQNNTMFNLTLGLIIILVIVILCIITFKVRVYLKRRNYVADEFELINE